MPQPAAVATAPSPTAAARSNYSHPAAMVAAKALMLAHGFTVEHRRACSRLPAAADARSSRARGDHGSGAAGGDKFRRLVWMVNVGDNWTCPYCGHAQVLSENRMQDDCNRQHIRGWKKGVPTVGILSIVCANKDCQELSLTVVLGPAKKGNDQAVRVDKHWTLLPPSSAKPQPDDIPQAIRSDYYEACAIRDLSPKASATITRRCLQGMIRDFCGISKSRLIDEIRELRKRVDSGHGPLGVQPDTVDAIDHIREIGNIGAHMEADINVIVDVDPNEAQVLIGRVSWPAFASAYPQPWRSM